MKWFNLQPFKTFEESSTVQCCETCSQHFAHLCEAVDSQDQLPALGQDLNPAPSCCALTF